MKKLSRRDFLATSSMTPFALLFSRQSRAPAGGKPNILFIMADDLGYADLSCYGRREYRTPNIDGIAAQGMKFTQAYANSAVCSATRTALITGRYQYRLQCGLEEPIAGRNVGLPPAHPTLPSLLRNNAGYGTTLIGKWHLGSLPDYSPLKSGYDHFWGFHAGAIDYFNHGNDLWDGDTSIHQAGYMTDLLGERAVSAINSYAKEGRPFLISLHFNAPHWPWEGADDEAESKRINGRLTDFDGGSLKTYGEMVTRMDLQIGRILQALETNGIGDNTIVIFTSDNGGERFSDTWPFTGKKTELLEGGLRIPAIVRWRGHVPAGATTDQVAISMDWLPTLTEIAGTRPDPSYPSDGISLVRTITQNAPPTSRKLFWRYKANLQEALRDGDMKYLKIAGNAFLFNVVEDPLERANLKDRQRETFQRMADEWANWNGMMLPLDSQSFTVSFWGPQYADHFGNKPPQ